MKKINEVKKDQAEATVLNPSHKFVIRQSFKLRMKTWPIRVVVMNLSWLPIWWMRKYAGRELRWTPTATLRWMRGRIDTLEIQNKRCYEGWRETEKKLEQKSMEELNRITNSRQKAIIKDAFGIDLGE